MKKLLYILLCILISINLISCQKKVASTGTEKINESSTAQDANVEADKNKENNNKDISTDASDSTKVNATETESKTETNTKSAAPQNKTTTKTTTQSTTQNTVQPKNNKIIVIDPGHANRSNLEKEPLAPGSTEMKIKDGGGAQGVATGTPEYRVNMNVAVKLKAILQNKGYTVVMTKTQDSQSLGNVERANIWNNANAALVIRIHADSSTNSSIKGASMLVPSPINNDTKAIYAASKSYGTTVLSTLVKEIGMANRGVTEHNDMTGFNWSKVPVILVEMGFLSNPDEDRLLSSQTYEDKLASALADGIAAAIK